MTITSKFRTNYWIFQLTTLIGGTLLIGLLYYLSLENGKVNYNNGLFWIAAMSSIGLALSVLYFLFSELKQITLGDEGIEINYILTKNKTNIPYHHIEGLTSKRIKMRVGSEPSPGYQELEIQLTNGQIITINENQFSNFKELKYLIYQNRPKNI
jgi:hypothetical protein